MGSTVECRSTGGKGGVAVYQRDLDALQRSLWVDRNAHVAFPGAHNVGFTAVPISRSLAISWGCGGFATARGLPEVTLGGFSDCAAELLAFGRQLCRKVVIPVSVGPEWDTILTPLTLDAILEALCARASCFIPVEESSCAALGQAHRQELVSRQGDLLVVVVSADGRHQRAANVRAPDGIHRRVDVSLVLDRLEERFR